MQDSTMRRPSFISCKAYPELGSVAYRQWRADSHCRLLHGYALSFEFKFRAATLDVRNWVMDFGGLKNLEAFLKDQFDHTLLVALDDPELETFRDLGCKGLARVREFDALGCERLSLAILEYVNEVYLPTELGTEECKRIECIEVTVRETVKNWALTTIG